MQTETAKRRFLAYIIIGLFAFGSLALVAGRSPTAIETTELSLSSNHGPYSNLKNEIKAEQYREHWQAVRSAENLANWQGELAAFDQMAKCGLNGCADEIAAEAARRAKAAADRAARSGARSSYAVYGTGACGGDLPPCSVMRCESGGNLKARNGQHTGKWQFARGTWGNYNGYPEASDAPEDVQDERARQYWDGGRGASHWRQCL